MAAHPNNTNLSFNSIYNSRKKSAQNRQTDVRRLTITRPRYYGNAHIVPSIIENETLFNIPGPIDPAIVAKMTQARSVINSKRMRPRPAPKSNIKHQDPYLMMRHVDNNKIPSIHCQCKWCILRNYANSITLTADAQNISATVMNGNKLIGAMKHFQKKIKTKLEPSYWDVIGAIINDHKEEE